MRRIWRLFRFSCLILWQTFCLSLKLRHLPERDRPLLKARHQQAACGKLCRVLGVDVSMQGTMPEGGTLLVVSNHLGLLDSLVLASRMPVAFAAKAEIAGWPIISWISRVVGVILVRRDQRMQTSIFVEQLQTRLREGVRVLVFPEGTTSNGQDLLPFKTGAFAAVADMEDGAVLPLYLKGVSVDGYPAEGATMQPLIWRQGVPITTHARDLLSTRKIAMEVRIGEPIATAGRDRKELAQMSFDAVVSLRDAMSAAS